MKKPNFRLTKVAVCLSLGIGSLLSCQKSQQKLDKAQDAKQSKLLQGSDGQYGLMKEGNLKGMVMLIDFSDAPANVAVDRADRLFNGSGYTEPHATTSVMDYWYRQSRGHVAITHDVRGYFRAPHTAAWYKSQDWTSFLTLAKQALEWFKTNNPNYDWNSLTVSNDPGEENTFLSMNFFTTVWIAGSGGTHRIDDWTAPNGKKLGQITAQSFFNQDPNDPNINLFWICHEMGHSVWGVPDTYDHDGDSEGDGKYSVMGGNMNNGMIEAFGAPFLMSQGWVNVVDIQPNTSYTLPEDGNTIARYKNPSNPKEYYLIEARKKTTLGNEMIPTARGLLVWHVDDNVTTVNDLQNRTQSQHYRWSIVQADGNFDLENGTNSYDGGDYYVQGNTLSNSTTPNSKWWDGTSSNINISNIQFNADNTISFNNGAGQGNQSSATSVYSVSSSQAGDGYINSLVDGITSGDSYWSSEYNSGFPINIVLTTPNPTAINGIQFAQRNPWGDASFTKDVAIYSSNDNVNYTQIGTHTVPQNLNLDNYIFPGGPVTAKYIKVVILNGASPNYATLSECNIIQGQPQPPTASTISLYSVSSSQEGDGYANALVDGITSGDSYWSSAYNSGFPINIVLKPNSTVAIPIKGVKLAQRNPWGNASFTKKVAVYSSSDNVNYTKIGTHTMPQNLNVDNYIFPNGPVTTKYIKVVILTGASPNYATLSECNLIQP